MSQSISLAKCSLVLAVCEYLLSSFCFSQDSVSISDFRYPETRAIDLKGGLSGSWGSATSDASQGFSDRIVDEGSRSDRQGRVGVNTSFLFFHATEGHIHTIQTDGSFHYDHGKSQSSFNQYNTNIYSSGTWRQDQKDISANLLWEYEHFPTETDIHVIGSAFASYRYTFRKQNREEIRSFGSSSTEDIIQFSDLRGEAVLGIGYGRMRDGSFVVKALRIIQRLMDDGMVSKQMTHHEILDLVDRVAHVREYTTNFERYEKFLVRDIVERLEQIGAVSPQQVRSFSAFRIAEAFRETVEPRFFGWRVYYAFGQTFVQRLNESLSSSSSSFHYFDKDQHSIHRVGMEVGYPISLYTHFHSDFKFDLPTISTNTRFSISSNTSLSYQLGERIDIVGNYAFNRTVSSPPYFGSSPYPRIISHKVSGDFRCYVEDLVTLTFSVQYLNQSSKTMYDNPAYLTSTQSRSSILFLLGINYNII